MYHPNILFITSDQHRGDSLGCAGHPCVRTPHLDHLFHEGTCFDNAYVDCPLCIPARTTLLSGIHGHNFGCCNWNPGFRVDIARERLLGAQLTQAGYQTEVVGKTHWQLDPSDRAGFEHVQPLAALSRQIQRETGRPGTNLTGVGLNELHPALSQLPEHLQSNDWIVDRCLDFLEDRQRDQPFFLWASFHDPHPPFVTREPYYSMYRDAAIPEPVLPDWLDTDACPKWLYEHSWTFNPGRMSPEEIRHARQVYYGMITHIDHQLGRLFGRLRNAGLWDDTVVVYTSDHGEQLGDYHDTHKVSFYEGSARIPMLVRFPESFGFEVCRHHDALVELADWYPTLLELAGCTVPDGLDGRSLLPLLDGSAASTRDFLHGQSAENHMFRTPTHKYLYFPDDGCEQVFAMDSDRRDDVLVDDAKLREQLRGMLVDHLIAEDNPCLVNGNLVNRGQLKLDPDTCRSNNALGWRG